MKRAAYFFELLLVVLLFGSCLTDTGSETDDRDVVIALTAFVEEGGTTASDPDYAIDDSLRVIMFDPNGGSIAYNEKPTPDDLIAVATGTYDIIIVANEASDPAFSARLDTYTPNSGKTMADLRYEYVSSSAIRNDVPIPM
ncbi:MAG: hypothetical protein LBM61_08030, partial [Prevotellaceae bacterium]|nr:hypothetical protein [Prevotellaceae bacterium]